MVRITLKNGVNVRLEWNYLVLQYIEEEFGGTTKLNEEYINDNQVKTMNTFVYGLLQANMDEELTFKQAVRLVKPEDMPKIFEFVKKEIEKSNKVVESKNYIAQQANKRK